MVEFDDVTLEQLANKITTMEELHALRSLWEDAKEAKRLEALEDLGKRSIKMFNVIDRMIGHIEFLSNVPGIAADGTIEELRERTGDIHADLHAAARVHTALNLPDPGSDGAITNGATTAAIMPGDIIEKPTPTNASGYAELAGEYVRFFNGAGIRPSKSNLVRQMADIAWSNRTRYQSVGQPLGIPWWFIAGLHQMESTYNFHRHLHNGDRLTARTKRVPAGRPIAGSPPFTFEESAVDALKLKGFHTESDWSLPRALFRFERYNGFGYRPRNVASPYLWSYTTIYGRGKYIADGEFDGNETSRQCGVAALLRQLVNDNRLELSSTQFADVDPADTAILPATVAATEILSDTEAAPDHPFKEFWNENLSEVEHFTWKELLFKGASNAIHKNNTDPPERLYNNIIPVVRALEEIRKRVGGPIRLLSVYRSPAYNGSIKDASANSRHMEFDAVDFQAVGSAHGSSSDWHRIAKNIRDEGVFLGGIGLYGSFVHIDSRGIEADWAG